MSQPEFTLLATFQARIVAEMAADVLKQEGIPALVQGAPAGFFSNAHGHGPHAARLLVPEDALEEARAVVGHLLE